MSATQLYEKQFAEALERGHRFGLDVPAVERIPQRLIFDDPHDETMRAVVEEVAKYYQANDLVGACLHASHLMRPIVSRVTGANAMFTVGAVTYLDKTLFQFDEAQLSEWLKNGLPSPAEGVHAWLTMPTMEIVDLTWMYTMKATVPHVLPQDPIPIFGTPDNLGITYIPLLVANDFVERVGAIRFGFF